MNASLLADVSRGCHEVGEILEMEKRILAALKWRMCGPTPQEFVGLYLALLDPRGRDADVLGRLMATDASMFQCEAAVADYDLSVNCRPSVIALAGIFNALDDIDEDGLSAEARLGFMRRLCRLLPDDPAYSTLVECVQTALRRLVREASVIDLPQGLPSGQEVPRSGSE